MSEENIARKSDLLRWMSPPKGGLWHGGPGVLSVLRSVSATQAAWKPSPDRHSIWELTLHLAYWKYAVRRRITNAPKGGFQRTPSDWPQPPTEPTEKAWKADRALLKSEHDLLVELISDFDSEQLDAGAGASGQWTHMDLLSGVVLHDTYHIGQIQLMKRLYQSTVE